MKRLARSLSLLMLALVASAGSSFAALSVADQTAIQTGISGADVAFYAIGGSILVVMAGIWGFKMVKRLF